MLSKLQLNKKVALHSHLVKGLFGLLRFGWGTFGPQNKQNKTSKMLNKLQQNQNKNKVKS